MSFRPSRYDGGGIRYLRFRGWLESLTGNLPALQAVYFEEVRRHVGTDAAHVYGGLLATLDGDDAKLVWARSDRTPWKAICARFGIARATADRRWECALTVITWRLNGRRVPTKRSRRLLVERARSASSTI